MRLKIKRVLSTVLLIAAASNSQAEVLLQDLHGQNTSLSSLKGKWVVINYWASWCKTCVAEIPEFNRFYHNHKNDPVALFAVNYDALPANEQKDLVKKLHINYPNLLNNPARELSLGDITGVPVTFIFNPEGKLVESLYGGQTARGLDKVINKNT